MSKRTFAPNRYSKAPGFCLDYDGGKYNNSFEVLDGDKNTGIFVSDTGDSNVPNSNKRTIVFDDKEYPLLRDAIFAYEDKLGAPTTIEQTRD